MKRRAVAVVVLVACGGKESAPTAPSSNVVAPVADAAVADASLPERDIVYAKLVGFRDQMCACTDKPCAEKVQQALARWSAEIASHPPDRQHPTEQELQEFEALGEAYGTCMAKLTGPSAGMAGAADVDQEIVLATSTRYRDEMCACTTKTCADSVELRLSEGFTKNVTSKTGEMSDDLIAKVTAIGQDFARCKAKANANP